MRRLSLAYHIAMGVMMAFMAWDMWVMPHPAIVVGTCGGG